MPVILSKKKYDRMVQDISDMKECNDYVRCNACHRLHDEHTVCPHCGHDGSDDPKGEDDGVE